MIKMQRIRDKFPFFMMEAKDFERQAPNRGAMIAIQEFTREVLVEACSALAANEQIFLLTLLRVGEYPAQGIWEEVALVLERQGLLVALREGWYRLSREGKRVAERLKTEREGGH